MSFLVNIGSKLHQQYRKVNLLQSTEDVSWLTIIKELVLTDDILADSVLKYFTPEALRQYLVFFALFAYLIFTQISLSAKTKTSDYSSQRSWPCAARRSAAYAIVVFKT